MPKSALRVARRIGVIIAATLATLLIVFISAVCVMEQAYRLYSRTVSERQFSINGDRWETDLGAIRKFETRHGLNPETRGGLRLAIDEWPSWKYLISVDAPSNRSAKGVILAIPYDGKGLAYEQEFVIEEREAKLFFALFDHQIDGYWGAATQCTDGTSFQFERWNNGEVSSGHGNAACQRHYAELMSLVAETLVVKLKDVPFDWRSWFWSKRELDLHDEGG